MGINREIGIMKKGPLNKITDVKGVKVGHCTLIGEGMNTGVTVVMPCEDNMYRRKLPCASYVLNGFGKSQGLVQVEELGQLETPIALTGTLNVGLVHDALVQYMWKRCEDDGFSIWTVNPIVCECNDAAMNTISERFVRAEHVFKAIETAGEDFEEGAVGGGRGMTCHGLKGGIGSASRVMEFNGKEYTLGVLAQTNHGRLDDLMVDGTNVGRDIRRRIEEEPKPDKGSCILILATDLPLTDRQLKRIIKRMSVGMARLGSFIGHQSGEVFVGFSTANRTNPDADIDTCERFNEDRIDIPFRAAAECAEEAILSAMLHATPVTALNGKLRRALNEFITNY